MVSEKYQVELVDTDYYRRAISCQNACPVHTNAQGYISTIADGDYETGYIIARQPNPFASICGRVCSSPCERACRRGKIDAPITIRTLKRFLCEHYGAEARSRLPVGREVDHRIGIARLNGKPPSNTQTIESFSQLAAGWGGASDRGREKSVPVAIIGAGAVGLTAAHDLALLGYKVTVFEAASEGGGMALLGIPEYRLPRDVLRMEIGEILDLNVDLRVNKRLGVDFSLASLQEEGFAAILIAIGAYKDKWLNIEGIGLEGVLAAVDFLTCVKSGHRVSLGDKVVVVGGGGAAEVGRKSNRPRVVDEETTADINLMTVMDAARQALRSGAREAHVLYRGTMEEMRASQSLEEVDHALEEGVIFHTGVIPKRVTGAGGKVTGFEAISGRWQENEKGQRALVPVPGSESLIECSSVILAIGQESDLSFIRPRDTVAFSDQGAIIVDNETLGTTARGIFAGGDAVRGPRTIIDAVADGHHVAKAIDNYLRGGRLQTQRRSWLVKVSSDALPKPDIVDIPRFNPPRIPVDKRIGVSEVEGVFDEKSAREQAERCLKCHIQTVFDGDLCILCGACVDICPQNCYKLVRLEKIEGDQRLDTIVEARFGMTIADFQNSEEVLQTGTALIKDETRCVRCGLCAKRCPTGAITMQAFHFEENLVYQEGENVRSSKNG